MKRAQRVILEVFGPPALAATIFEIVALVGVREVAALKLFPMFLIFGYLVAGYPASPLPESWSSPSPGGWGRTALRPSCWLPRSEWRAGSPSTWPLPEP
jgi:ABC-type uncharacterized transport system permease subunit